MMSILGMSVLLLGGILLVLAAAGLFLLKDPLSRQHAATKAGTLALGLIVLGAAIASNTADWYIRALLILLALFMTLPVASHMLARSAVKEKKQLEIQKNIPRY